jgi:hypothetical protein
MKYYNFTQGYNFDAYESTSLSKGYLFNVAAADMAAVNYHDIIEIDFDGDGALIWGAVVTGKDTENNRLHFYIF